MRASLTKDGLTLRVIAGTHSAILGMDLDEDKRKGCLGFSIYRTELGPVSAPFAEADVRSGWLPNMLRFPADQSPGAITTETAPLQKFRWGDYTLKPASTYRFRVVPRYGAPDKLLPEFADHKPSADDGIELEFITEDKSNPETSIHFNRAAAASHAFEAKFGNLKKEGDIMADTGEGKLARAWLSNGLEEAILDFLAQAADDSYALHGAVYEFQKTNLLAGLKAAQDRGAEVKIAYHHRQKNDKDKTARENDEAVEKAGFKEGTALPRKCNPQSAIMHNKFVVLLKKIDGQLKPQAVWTGSTNWTNGGVYGQLNVGHAVYDEEVAAIYEKYFELLAADSDAQTMKHTLATLNPVSLELPAERKVTPILSPQSDDTMLRLYASICENARCLMVSAPFELSELIRATLTKENPGMLRYLLVDKTGSLGDKAEIAVIEGDPDNEIAAATTISSPLTDFQGRLLEGKESFHHAGIHIHSKIILADPFSSDPIVVTGSANFSNNSTQVNDSNTLVLRGFTAVADIYATEFMRMFEHYHFRASRAAAADRSKPFALAPDDSWSEEYYVPGSYEEKDRKMFAGTS